MYDANMHSDSTNDMMNMGNDYTQSDGFVTDVSVPDMLTDDMGGTADFGGDDLSVGMDVSEGNSTEMMMYQDPLIHAHDFQPDPFLYQDDSFNVDGTSNGADLSPVNYITDAHGGIMPFVNNVNSLPGVQNGMLTDSSQLQQIIDMGQIDGAQHIHDDDIVRSADMKKAFLHQHGYTEVPVGYEIHHIVPLSEGGADNPQNMILLSEDDYNAVMSAQHMFYGW